MAQASASIELAASPDHVWRLVGGFGSLPEWLPYIPKSELIEGGRVRRITTEDGGLIVERLESFDEADRSYSYSFVESPFPVSRYRATLHVRPADEGDGSRVDWYGEFTPVGVSDEEASRIFLAIYEGGLKALADQLGG
ncbi:SRPBCC family protein [Paludisphaera rhizosphaerae]|uniref:SRPBCC family protein n=1 Tax=Paludisphaera rhizosphaerae TaxID=2711216 RepID=UPI0013EB4AAC|nr:SRPBCC family protein [Paludisphaera rhizosphaerae]